MSAVIKDLNERRERALETAMKSITKSYGAGAVMMLDDDAVSDIEVISTGSIGIDKALVVGGIPKGRITEIYGPEASGKTTLTLQIIAEAQKEGGRAAFIDAEHALDRDYAEALGVDTSQLLLSQPDYGEQGLEIAETLIRSGAVDLVVIDSVAALIPKAELEADFDAAQMGVHARMMSKACRKLAGLIKQTNCTMIFVNQIRMKIGVMFGSPETTTGGRALKFFSSVRIDIRAIGNLKSSDDEIVGKRTKVKIVKNKVAPPFRWTEFDVIFGKGIWRPAELIEQGVATGLIQKSGAWYSKDGEQIAQGKGNAAEHLVENPVEAAQLETDIRFVLFGKDEEVAVKTKAESSGEA